ncbi:MAG TPA: hypothetical protein VK474_11645 [Chthoniobacterales bacterium]|nr:hypothetical protein [Chthoniobacterales bacterium]
MNIKTHLNLLGLKVEDRVTGFTGVVTSIGFDLYGCVQAIVLPGADKDGKPCDSHWFDVNRLRVTSNTPVMDRPNFEFGPQAEGRQGAAEKPMGSRAE